MKREHPGRTPSELHDLSVPAPDDATLTTTRRRLLDLAYDASSYLRHHREPAVRASAALLLAASLAACSPSNQAGSDLAPVVTPLQSEVKNGLPSSPGRYQVEPENIARDAQGVYHFNWRQSGGAEGSWNQASASLLRLAEGDADELEIPSSGDPILHLRNATPVSLIQEASDLRTPTPTTGSSSGSSSTRTSWYPFSTTSGTGSGGTSGSSSTATTNRTPAYRDPPSRVVAQGSVVRGGSVSTSPQPAPSRVVSTSRSTAGQAGGTGGGSAVSSKSGSTTSQGAARPGSSGFSGGKSGSTGSSGG